MAEPQTATEGRVKSGAEADRSRGDGQRVQGERATWAEPGARPEISPEQREQVAAAEQAASEMARDWTSTLMALYARNLSMASRRSRAIADYWDDMARARQPAELMNATARYWSGMIGDYSNFTMSEGELIRNLIPSGRPH
jgi:hypothetical protein